MSNCQNLMEQGAGGVITNIAEFLSGVVTMFCKVIVMKAVHSCEHILSIESLTLYGQLYICI